MPKYKTRQQIFNNAWKGFEKQGWKYAYTNDDQCLYRGPNGIRCAIGWNIPNINYNKYLEGSGVSNNLKVIEAANIDIEDREFASKLQDVHDDGVYDKNVGANRDLKKDMKAFAKIHNLTIPS